jgi:hypothetical protein
MTETANRDNAGKPALSEVLYWPQALAEWAAHAQAGRAKYPDAEPGVPNWTLGGKPDDEYLNAAMRHLSQMRKGEDYDAELGTTHAAAVIWNIATLVQCNYEDRPTAHFPPAPETPAPGYSVTYEGRLGIIHPTTDGCVITFDDGGRLDISLPDAERAESMGVLVYL